MSEAERRKREEYRKKRKRWLFIQAIVLAVVSVALIVCSALFRHLNETVYITYRETSAVDYKVGLKENDFYLDENGEKLEWLDKDQAYVASLIDSVSADFSYSLDMDVKNVDYEYSYKIVAQLLIVDDNTKGTLYSPIETLKQSEHIKQSSNKKLSLKENVQIDYTKYNEKANAFNEAYGLKQTTSSLVVKMLIAVEGSCDEFEENSVNNYVVSLHMPLTQKALTIEMQSTVPTGESKVLACDSGFNADLYKKAILGLSVADALLAVIFVCVIFFTRNEDINYALKVQKLLSDYRSYIQRINNGFDTTGYQLLAVDTFNEMLAIRDTIQSPILMSENKDKTRTLFLIPTNTKILYTHEIKVENYDDLYRDSIDLSGAAILKDELSVAETPVAPVAETMVEEPVLAVVEEPAVESVEETAVAEEPAVEIKVVSEEELEEFGEDDEDGNGFGPVWNYSFEAKLALTTDEVKGYYRRIVGYALSYGVKVARSWKRERIYKGRKLFAALAFRGKKLVIALALDPKPYVESKYHAKDFSDIKKYEKTPMVMRITSDRKVKYAIELLTKLFEEAGLTNKNLGIEVDPIAYRSKKRLLAQGLIKTTADTEHLVDDTPEEPVVESASEETDIFSEEALALSEDEFAKRFGPSLDYSFEAKLSLAAKEVKEYYKQVSDYARAYGVKVVRSWKWERIYMGRNLFALLTFKGNKLAIALALDPKMADPKYHAKDISDSKKYEKTPMLMRITSPRKVKYAIELLEELFKSAGLENKEFFVKTKAITQKSKKTLFANGLIRYKKR